MIRHLYIFVLSVSFLVIVVPWEGFLRARTPTTAKSTKALWPSKKLHFTKLDFPCLYYSSSELSSFQAELMKSNEIVVPKTFVRFSHMYRLEHSDGEAHFDSSCCELHKSARDVKSKNTSLVSIVAGQVYRSCYESCCFASCDVAVKVDGPNQNTFTFQVVFYSKMA